MIEWHNIEKEGYPKKRKSGVGYRILVYSPVYEELDEMTYRILNSQFLKTCIDVSDWAYLSPPEKGS